MLVRAGRRAAVRLPLSAVPRSVRRFEMYRPTVRWLSVKAGVEAPAQPAVDAEQKPSIAAVEVVPKGFIAKGKHLFKQYGYAACVTCGPLLRALSAACGAARTVLHLGDTLATRLVMLPSVTSPSDFTRPCTSARLL
jgi:hypothetical protein